MGGKKKKRAEAAVLAAAAASRQQRPGGAERVGDQSPRPTAAKPSAKEVKARAGPKTYSFGATPTHELNSAGNLDKSILKVVIKPELEQKIIRLINQFRTQQSKPGTISGRLTAKKLQDLYMALQRFSFHTEDIEEAMKNTVIYGGDLHSALDWLCLNLPDDALPDGFSQKMQEEEIKTKPKFQMPVVADTKDEASEGHASVQEPQAKATNSENTQVSMKEWILQYAEKANNSDDNDDQDNEIPETAPEKEEHFDPNELYLELTAKLLDTKERALSFKQNNNKHAHREAGERIKILQQEIKQLEKHPAFDPSIKMVDLKKNDKSSTRPPDDKHEGALNLTLLEESAKKLKEETKNEPKDVRNFDYTARSWTGKSPKQFLIDWCRKNLPTSPAPNYRKIAVGRFWKSSVRINRQKDGILEVCPTILTEDSMQAQHLASTLALWHLVQGQAIHQLLPPTYREVWIEWSETEKQKKVTRQMERNKPREQFIARLLNTVKQKPSTCVSPTPEDPEDSWENLLTEDDFSLSIDNDRADNLDSAKIILKNLQSSNKFQKLLKDRQLLPVFQHRMQILETLRRHRVVVVAGETGSGKSTQIPQFLLQDLLLSEATKCNIICTQPRRISAVSLATRVCEELGCEEGPGGKNSLCGYQIRMETKVGETSRLLYCTTGVLLRKMQQDAYLSSVTHVIVDEVHERSVQSDFLLIILKELMQKHSNLNLILMSATVDSDKFAQYFGHCPVINIPGRIYPVEVFHLEDVVEETGYILDKDSEYYQQGLDEEEEINLTVTGKGGRTFQHQEYFVKGTRPGHNLILDPEKYSSRTCHAVQYMHPTKINIDLTLELINLFEKCAPFRAIHGAVLVFLPGLAYIQQLHDLLTTDRRFQDRRRFKVIALHSILSSQDQAAAFTVPPQGVRKIVLATNIAETGITIPDVVFVIDCGKTKENRYHESSQMSSLVETFISKANALQRQGRAGRVREGFCFRLYTQERYDSFMDYSVPEILRVPLEELCLHVMKCNHGSPEDFLAKALDPPQLQVISNAMNLLKKIGACEINEAKLTPLGQHLAALPVNVKIGKMLIFGAIFGCLEPVAIIAAAMTEKTPFVTPMNGKEEANLAKAALALANSDHLTIYNAYLGWKDVRYDGYRAEMNYCKKHFLSRTALLTMEDIKQELIKLMETVGFVSRRIRGTKLQCCSKEPLAEYPKKSLYKEFPLLKAVLTAGLYDNIGKIIYTPSVDITDKMICSIETAQGKAQLHPSSVNRDLQTNGWLLYKEKVKYGKIYVRETTLTSPFPVLLFGGDIEVMHRERLLSVDGWIHFQAPVRTGIIFKQLRSLIESLLQKKLEDPKMSIEDDEIIQIVMELIKTENSD
ncbi:ATP-dependent RNA helicase DHX29 isoform X1 [Scyliorhinus canicula]|uniref:ATP-dependent RNA helicase DHX29 isoform X1 n=3 Tax=Scyliorhinus canicula TaxID=7830 RepID=UPI0018F476B0|nr:ATP-dependent RNA helicase DHX29 isoform X1 [Scyliorhinus canicula]